MSIFAGTWRYRAACSGGPDVRSSSRRGNPRSLPNESSSAARTTSMPPSLRPSSWRAVAGHREVHRPSMKRVVTLLVVAMVSSWPRILMSRETLQSRRRLSDTWEVTRWCASARRRTHCPRTLCCGHATQANGVSSHRRHSSVHVSTVRWSPPTSSNGLAISTDSLLRSASSQCRTNSVSTGGACA